METIDERTPFFGLQLPHAANMLYNDVARIRQAITGLDADLKGLQNLISSHHHAMGDVDGLGDALSSLATWVTEQIGTRSPSGHTHALGDLGAAASGHTHTPASIGAAAAAHNHSTSNVTNLDALLAARPAHKGAATNLGSGTVIDLALNTDFFKTVSANTTFTFANVGAAGGLAQAVSLIINHTAGTITFSGVTIKWVNGIAPTWTTGRTHQLIIWPDPITNQLLIPASSFY